MAGAGMKRSQHRKQKNCDFSCNENKCKPKHNKFTVIKKGDNISKLQHQDPKNCDLSCKTKKHCLKVTKKGDELVKLQYHEIQSQSSSECENDCEPCLIVIKKGDEITKLSSYEPEHITCSHKPCSDLHVIQHCDGNACYLTNCN